MRVTVTIYDNETKLTSTCSAESYCGLDSTQFGAVWDAGGQALAGCLLAAGFHPDTVAEAIALAEDDHCCKKECEKENAAGERLPAKDV